MHISSMDKMRAFREKYLESRTNTALQILDIGSQEVNGSYKSIFSDQPLWKYQGCDMVEGKNVDIVLTDPYDWKQIKSNSADVIISGQAFEHVELFWITMLEIARVLKPGGLCCIIAPSGGFEHRYPVDCWRFYPDGFSALAKYAKLSVVESYTQWEDLPQYDNDNNCWHDSVLIARKDRAIGFRDALRQQLIQWSRQL